MTLGMIHETLDYIWSNLLQIWRQELYNRIHVPSYCSFQDGMFIIHVAGVMH